MMSKLPVRVLYVEDDEDIAQEVIEFLSYRVLKVYYAKDGEDAYNIYKTKKIDLLITDIQMPKMNGLELIEKIREQKSLMPVIVTTAYSDNNFLLESINLGVDGYLLKPLDLKTMYETIEKVVRPMLMRRRIEELNARLIEINAELEERVAMAVEENTRHLQEENSKMKQMAFYDTLTGIANRALIYAMLEKEIKKAERKGSSFALFFIDLDNFKSINDDYGHYIGDLVLVKFTQKLQSALRESDTIGRLGGDEFLLIAPDIQDMRAVHILADKIVNLFKEPLEIDAYNSIQLSCSIGISCYPQDATSMEELIQDADRAMYSIKREKKESIAFYSECRKKALC
jgi:diguanylate cyclase (GGDEF)-like protein